MPTQRIRDSIRPLAARTLIWVLLLGGWLVLGALGHMRLPFRAAGLAPLALWLAAIGLGLGFERALALSAGQRRAIVVLAGAATAAGLAWAAEDGGAAAIVWASIGWGVLLVAAVRTMPACPARLIQCTLPAASWARWSDPSAWAVQSARWAMLPMMASLAVTAQWCGSAWGLTPWQSIGLHLGAMLLPPVALHLSRVRLQGSAGVALAMTAGLAMLCILPLLQGLMAASMCHSLAWGLAWSGQAGAPPHPSRRPRRVARWLGALLPAGCIWLLGLAIDATGPWALWGVHAVLGTLATVGAALSLCPPAFFSMERKP